MGLYIRDDRVNELAGRLAALTGTTKTQAVREALESRLAAMPAQRTRSRDEVMAGLREVQAQARAAGFVRDPTWTEADEKAFMDDLSGGI